MRLTLVFASAFGAILTVGLVAFYGWTPILTALQAVGWGVVPVSLVRIAEAAAAARLLVAAARSAERDIAARLPAAALGQGGGQRAAAGGPGGRRSRGGQAPDLLRRLGQPVVGERAGRPPGPDGDAVLLHAHRRGAACDRRRCRCAGPLGRRGARRDGAGPRRLLRGAALRRGAAPRPGSPALHRRSAMGGARRRSRGHEPAHGRALPAPRASRPRLRHPFRGVVPGCLRDLVRAAVHGAARVLRHGARHREPRPGRAGRGLRGAGRHRGSGGRVRGALRRLRDSGARRDRAVARETVSGGRARAPGSPRLARPGKSPHFHATDVAQGTQPAIK